MEALGLTEFMLLLN